MQHYVMSCLKIKEQFFKDYNLKQSGDQLSIEKLEVDLW